VWELQFKSKGEENSTGSIFNLELVSVVINFEDVENFSDDIEVAILFGGSIKSFSLSSTVNVALGEIVSSPFREGLLDSSILFLVGAFLSGERIWSLSWGSKTIWHGFVGRVKSP